ncbi:MAG: hypothetical protein IJU91_01110 [Selenomonadaceae bacterium]|nr:hypothetical protein [Selenomonadaceae bacterium]
MIHVCYGLYDGTGRYSKFTGTSILSMFENVSTPPRSVTVHLLHDDTLTDDNRDKFSYIAGQYNQLIKFYNVEKICADELAALKEILTDFSKRNFTIGTMFRLLMTKIFSDDIGKVIYLDSDTVVNLDIGELWKIPLDDKTIAAVPESTNGIDGMGFPLCKDGLVRAADYFNAGVIIINLDKLRGSEFENFQAEIKFIAENPKYIWMDQDIFNYCFSKNMVKLSSRFNFSVRNRGEQNVKNKICHYLGKTLNLGRDDKFNRLWFKYFKKTRWFDEDVIFNFYDEFKQRDAELKNFAAQVSALMSGKSRTFFVEAMNIEFIKRVFYVQAGEEIIPAVNQESVQALKESMKSTAGSKLYFILIGIGYEIVRAELMKEGFAEGRDFINAVEFLSPIHGIPMNMYYENSLIKML